MRLHAYITLTGAKMAETKQEVKVEEVDEDVFAIPTAEVMEDMGEIMPTMNVNPTLPAQQTEEKCIIDDEKILGLYEEILNNQREDRKQHDEILVHLINMVLNDGDASSATKEAMVNVLKSKADITDKMAKIADLMTRIKLKDKDTFPRYLAAHQHNNVTIESNNTKRDILKALQAAKKKGGK
jgi:hypothetical protein